MDKIKNFMKVPNQTTGTSLALLALRVAMGIAFILHGWGKIQTPFSWMPPESPVPGFLQLLAAVSEFGGGMALILGLLTRLASLGLMFTMLVATFFHAVMMGDPFVRQGPGSAFELPLMYGLLAILFIVVGPGKFSVDAKILPKN